MARSWPLLHVKLEREYGVFRNSATILIWAFVSAMIILAAAQWAARMENQNEQRFENGYEKRLEKDGAR